MTTHVLEFFEKDKISLDSIREGSKTIETRAWSEKYSHVQVGDTLEFVCGDERFSKQVTKIYHWPGVEAMASEKLKEVVPWLETSEQAKELIYSFPRYKEKIEAHGLSGFELV